MVRSVFKELTARHLRTIIVVLLLVVLLGGLGSTVAAEVIDPLGDIYVGP